MSNFPKKLKVPSITFSDKTPTPTRLLKAVDAIGLFRESVDASSAKSTSSNNPFDETFRKALDNNVDLASEQDNNHDDVLNTPQIINDTPNPSAFPKKLKPIAPIGSQGLQLRLPENSKEVAKKGSNGQIVSKKRKCAIDKDDLKARNRAAAIRSRQKKKQMTESLHKQIDVLSKRNQSLVKENELLKAELAQLKQQLHCNKAPVIIKVASDNLWNTQCWYIQIIILFF